MIKTGNKLICTDGNEFYQKGELYTVGEFINDRYFELLLEGNNECWYGTVDDKGIYVHFADAINHYSNAWFDTV